MLKPILMKSGVGSLSLCLSAFLGLWLSLEIRAAEQIEGLYEARVVIADRSDAARARAIRQGLEQVLVRYSGFSGIGQLPGAQSFLNNSSAMAVEFGPQTLQLPAADGLGLNQQDGLWVRYNAAAVERLVRQWELPIWPTLRPEIQYLVVTESLGEQVVATDRTHPAWHQMLQNYFVGRGLPASAMTFEDNNRLSPVNLWSMDDQVQAQLQSELDAELLLVLRISDGLATTSVDLVVLEEGTAYRRHMRSSEPFDGLAKLLDNYVDQLSVDLAFLGGSNSEEIMFMRIYGLRSFSDYHRIQMGINSLEQVLSARLWKADDLGVELQIDFQSDRHLLLESIATIADLRLIEASAGTRQDPVVFSRPSPVADMILNGSEPQSSGQFDFFPQDEVQQDSEAIDTSILIAPPPG